MKQWQCPTCGQWVDMTYSRHTHAMSRLPTMAEIIAARQAGKDEEALNVSADYQHTYWSADYPRRDKPNE